MDKQVISFSVNEQRLNRVGNLLHISSNPVSYVEAHFELGENWGGFDSVRAMFYTSHKCVAAVLNDGVCIVPFEVLTDRREVYVNLVGSIVENDELTDRLTSYPCLAIKIDGVSRICGEETKPVTPSQFEQFVAMVRDEASEVLGMTATAESLPTGSEATASYSNGVLTFGIPRGEKGDRGEQGEQGIQGEKGEKGADGFSPTATVVKNGDTATITITDKDGTTTAQISDGTGGSGAVESVNGKVGAVVLTASDVGAISAETDPTVPAWAKAPSKPTYTASEVGALPNTTVIPTVPTNVSAFTNDAGYLTSAVTSFNGNTGAVTYSAPVSSVNGQTGAVVIGNATTSSAGLMSATDKTNLNTLMDDYSSALTALGVI